MKSYVTFFAHPDDEILAIGATMAKAAWYINHWHVLIPATGITARTKTDQDKGIKTLRENTKAALAHVCGKPQYADIKFGEFPDNKLDTIPILELAQWLEHKLTKIFAYGNTIVIYTHHQFDLNIDHRKCFEAAIIATRARPNIIVICCEVPSSTGYLKPTHWEPNHYQEVSIVNVRRKIQAMQKYKSEKRAYPHPRSPEALEALARIRGVECGCKYAESFMIYKKVEQL